MGILDDILKGMQLRQKVKERNIDSAGEMLAQIKETEVLECGCCYKLSEPVFDMLAVELALNRTAIQKAVLMIKGDIPPEEGDTKEQGIIKLLEAAELARGAIFKYILEIVKVEAVTGFNIYTKSMKGHAKKYQDDHPSHSPTCFDNILGIQDFMLKAADIKKKGGSLEDMFKETGINSKTFL